MSLPDPDRTPSPDRERIPFAPRQRIVDTPRVPLPLTVNPFIDRPPSANPCLSSTTNRLLDPAAPRLTTADVEREFNRLPHLRTDRRHMAQAIKQNAKDARQAETAAEAIGSLPGPDETLHLAISGRFALWHVVPAVLALSGRRIETLHVATLGFSRANIDALCKLLDSGDVGHVRLLASLYFKSTSSANYQHAVESLATRPAEFIGLRTHAKLLLMKLDDGRTFTVESSANLRSCRNVEQLTVFGDPGAYQFHAAWLDELFVAARAAGSSTGDNPERTP